MNSRLKSYLVAGYSEAKSDLFAAFIVRNMELTSPSGEMGFVTPYVWMFLSSYDEFRRFLLARGSITTLVQLEYNAFAPATIPVCVFTLRNKSCSDAKGVYIRLSAFRGSENQGPRTLEAISNPNCGWSFSAAGRDFEKLPGAPIAYWMSSRTRNVFNEFPSIGTIAAAKQGLITGDNERFLRLWYEVEQNTSAFGMTSRDEAKKSNKRWFPFQKGGTFRKWYGNQEFVVDWWDDGTAIRTFVDDSGHLRSRPQSMDYYFLPGITWTSVTITTFNCRLCRSGFIYSEPGPLLYAEKPEQRACLAGFLNSKPGNYLLQLFAPGMHYNQGHVSLLPSPELSEQERSTIGNAVERLVAIAEEDWDARETSWAFRDLQLLSPERRRPTLQESYARLRANWRHMTLEMKEIEEKSNRIFIGIYGLQDDLTPEVPLPEVSLDCNPHYRYGSGNGEERLEELLLGDTMREFLSYAVGCMFGRYSIDSPGLILANSGDTLADYLHRIPTPRFTPSNENVIPILDGEWFEVDIVARTREFLQATFGEATLEANGRFIEESLGKDLRKYFLTDFYKDHLQTYKKRPIYWLFSSGKERAFQALVYLHRYHEGTLSRMRTEYVIPLQGKIASRIDKLADDIQKATSTSHRKKMEKERDKLLRQRTELQAFDEKLRHYADQRIQLDLDDGVKVNYGKFGDLLADVNAVTGGSDE